MTECEVYELNANYDELADVLRIRRGERNYSWGIENENGLIYHYKIPFDSFSENPDLRNLYLITIMDYMERYGKPENRQSMELLLTQLTDAFGVDRETIMFCIARKIKKIIP